MLRSALKMQTHFREKHNGFNSRDACDFFVLVNYWGLKLGKWVMEHLTSSFTIIPSLMLHLFVCQSVRASLSVSFSALDYTEAVQRSLKAPSVTKASEHIFLPSPLQGPESRTKQRLDDITDIGFRRTPHPSGEREGRDIGRGQRELIRIFLSQSDDPYCQVTVLESSWVWGIFQLQQGVETLKGDVERGRAIELLG